MIASAKHEMTAATSAAGPGKSASALHATSVRDSGMLILPPLLVGSWREYGNTRRE